MNEGSKEERRERHRNEREVRRKGCKGRESEKRIEVWEEKEREKCSVKDLQ